MEKGTVKEEGTHDELMALGGKYLALVEAAEEKEKGSGAPENNSDEPDSGAEVSKHLDSDGTEDVETGELISRKMTRSKIISAKIHSDVSTPAEKAAKKLKDQE